MFLGAALEPTLIAQQRIMSGLACKKSSEGRHTVEKILRRVICATRPIAPKSLALRFGRVQLDVALLVSPRDMLGFKLSMKFATAVVFSPLPWVKYERAER